MLNLNNNHEYVENENENVLRVRFINSEDYLNDVELFGNPDGTRFELDQLDQVLPSEVIDCDVYRDGLESTEIVVCFADGSIHDLVRYHSANQVALFNDAILCEHANW